MYKNLVPITIVIGVFAIIGIGAWLPPQFEYHPSNWATGCSVLKGDPQLPTDLATIESCIQQAAESGVTNPAAIAITCSHGEEQFVVDFLAALLKSTWASSHTALVAGLQTGITQYNLRFDGGVK